MSAGTAQCASFSVRQAARTPAAAGGHKGMPPPGCRAALQEALRLNRSGSAALKGPPPLPHGRCESRP